ncbi:T9SS type A sorting domain-containing protein [Bacteroidota bacterium]
MLIIRIYIISLDTLVSVSSFSRSFEDIPAGKSSTSKQTLSMTISEECPVNTEVPILVYISCYDKICWIDTLYIQVQAPVSMIENRERITRIYLNPSNDVINIEIENVNNTMIDIYDITGKKIYSKSPVSTLVKIDMSGYSKGIYLVKVKQVNVVYVNKIIVN